MCKALCSGTQKVADEHFATLSKAAKNDSANADFLAALAGTLKAVYIAAKEYKPLVQSAFGPGYVVSLVLDIIKDLDNKVLLSDCIQMLLGVGCGISTSRLTPWPLLLCNIMWLHASDGVCLAFA